MSYTSNSALRDRVTAEIQAGYTTWGTICKMIGWTRVNHSRYGQIQGDSARLKRALGLLPKIKGKKRYYQRRIRDDIALAIAEAIDIDPVEVDL